MSGQLDDLLGDLNVDLPPKTIKDEMIELVREAADVVEQAIPTVDAITKAQVMAYLIHLIAEEPQKLRPAPPPEMPTGRPALPFSPLTLLSLGVPRDFLPPCPLFMNPQPKRSQYKWVGQCEVTGKDCLGEKGAYQWPKCLDFKMDLAQKRSEIFHSLEGGADEQE